MAWARRSKAFKLKKRHLREFLDWVHETATNDGGSNQLAHQKAPAGVTVNDWEVVVDRLAATAILLHPLAFR